MKQTTNYKLTQWELHDRVIMDDFNDNNAKIDAALGEHAASLTKLGNCRIELIAYTGNGLYTIENPTTLTFSDIPEAVLLGGDRAMGIYFKGSTSGSSVRFATSSTIASTFSVQWEGTVMKLYSSNAGSQFNVLNDKYYALALYAEDKA